MSEERFTCDERILPAVSTRHDVVAIVTTASCLDRER